MQEALSPWELFNFLCRRRNTGWGPTPIPVSEAVVAFELFGFQDIDEWQVLLRLIDSLDDVWLRWARSKTTDKTKDGVKN